MNEEKFNALCKKIEDAINSSFTYLWHRDNLSNVHAVFFPQYDEDQYTVVFHDGYHVAKHLESILLETTPGIEEEEVDLEHLRPELEQCTENQLSKLESLYNLHMGSNILAYYPVNGFYALIKAEDYDPDQFDCGALPYSF